MLAAPDAEGLPMTETPRIGPILWRGRYLIALSLVVTVALSIVATKLSSKVYEATAILQVSTPNAPPGESTDLANQGLAKNYATVIVSRSFLQKIRRRVEGGRLTPASLQSHLSARAVELTALVELTAQGSSPEQAQRLASQVADALLATLQTSATQRAAQQQQQIQRIISDLSAKIDGLGGGASSGTGTAEQIASLRAARAALTNQSATLLANGVAQGSSATLTAPPTASSAPVKPRPALNIAAGVLLGLLLGIGLAWLRERLGGGGLHSAEDATDIVDVPLLASIPLRRRVLAGDPVLNEAYEVLRANLVFQSRDRALGVVTFLSQNPAVGKTSAVEGFAYAAVRGGSNVLVIDGDLRAGTLSSRLGYADAPGLTNVIVGTSSIDEAIVSLAPGLSLLTARLPVPNPPSLLYSDEMRELMAELRDRYDLIVVDSPPIAHLADGLILASLSDGVVTVARTGVTKRSDLRAVIVSLRQSGAPLVGLVVFEPRTIDKTYYPAVAQAKPLDRDSVIST